MRVPGPGVALKSVGALGVPAVAKPPPPREILSNETTPVQNFLPCCLLLRLSQPGKLCEGSNRPDFTLGLFGYALLHVCGVAVQLPQLCGELDRLHNLCVHVAVVGRISLWHVFVVVSAVWELGQIMSWAGDLF